MARSLFRQLDQIRSSATYDDSIPDVTTSGVAEPTISGSLEYDLNVIRSVIKQLKNTPNWFDATASIASADEKYVESPAVDILANVEHILPFTYTPSSTTGREGKNMDVYLDGQLLAADTGVSGINADRDYGETMVSGITFRLDIKTGRNITYVVRQ